MVYKINISQEGKSYQVEKDVPSLEGKKIGEALKGSDINPELKGYELEITGTSDSAGFPGSKNQEGDGLRKVILKKGFGMKTRQRKEGEGKKRQMPKGFKQKKTVRGNVISENIVQINLNVVKEGNKKLEDVFGGGNEEEGDSGEKGEDDDDKKGEDKNEENKSKNKEGGDGGEGGKGENEDKGKGNKKEEGDK